MIVYLHTKKKCPQVKEVRFFSHRLRPGACWGNALRCPDAVAAWPRDKTASMCDKTASMCASRLASPLYGASLEARPVPPQEHDLSLSTWDSFFLFSRPQPCSCV